MKMILKDDVANYDNDHDCIIQLKDLFSILEYLNSLTLL